MTPESLDKAKENRSKREEAMKEYYRVNDKINSMSKYDDSPLYAINHGKTTIYPTVAEFRAMLIIMRDRLDRQIEKLDKEFEEM